MNAKKVWLATCAALLCALVASAGIASPPVNPFPAGAFATRGENALSLGRFNLPVERAASDMGATISRPALRAPPPLSPETTQAITAAIKRPLAEKTTRVVVDLDNKVVYVRRGDVERTIPVDVRGRNAGSAHLVAEAARTAVQNDWVPTTGIVVDGSDVGLLTSDGPVGPVAAVMLTPRTTERLTKAATAVATR